MMGDPAEADEHFTAADRLQVANEPGGDHLYSLAGTRWADWLARSGRTGAAAALANRGLEIARQYGWNADAARCERQLGRLALAAGDSSTAGRHLAEAAACFRDGDFLIELAVTLADQAAHARATGDVDAAHQYAAEAIGIAAPRKMVLAQSGALAVRARIYASQATSQAAARTRAITWPGAGTRPTPRCGSRPGTTWPGTNSARWRPTPPSTRPRASTTGGPGKPRVLHARLVPPGLDPDPLGTVERLVAEQKAGQTASW